MKKLTKKIIIIMLFGMFLFIPGNVFAEEYTYEIGNGKEWNESNLEELSERLDELSEQDEEDNRYDNKYIFKFADGDYDYSNYSFHVHGRVEYHFGVGNYNLSEMEMCTEMKISFYGTGIDKTNLIFDDLYVNIWPFSMENMTVTCSYFRTDICSCHSSEIMFSSDSDFSDILFKNVIFNIEEADNIELILSDLPVDIVYDNVKFNGIKTILFEIESERIIKNAKIEFINSDLSNVDLVAETGYGNGASINISNSKVNKIIEFGTKVIVDCDSTFVNGKNRKKMSSEEFEELLGQTNIENYDFTSLPDAIYELTYQGVQNGKVLMEVCKDKDAVVRKNISLKSIKDEFGFSIDKTWKHNPSGYVDVTDDIMIPYRPGIVKISKENNEELQTLRLNIKDQTFTNNVITNPQTGRNILILIAIAIISGFLIRKTIKRKI